MERQFSFKINADTVALTRLQNELKLSERIAASVGKTIAQELTKGVDGAASEIRGKRSSVQSAIESAFKGDYSTIGKTIGFQVESGLKSSLSGLKGAIGNIFQGIFQGIGQSIYGSLQNGLQGAFKAITDQTALINFDKAKASVSTLTDDVSGAIKVANDLSKELRYSVSSSEALAASYDVLSAGFTSAADSANVLRAAQKGAIGGFSDLNTVSNATTTILNAYGMSSEKATMVVDQMIGTQNAGKIVVSEYASLIGRLASTAAVSGVALEEMNAFIATATVKGVAAGSTMDGLRQAISNVLKPSQEAAEYAAQLGIGFDAATLKSKGLAGILADLRARGADGADSLTKLFGSVEAVAAIIPSAGAGIEDFKKNLETIKNTKADDAFNKVSNSMEGLKKRNQVLREELALKFQTAIAPVFAGANTILDALLVQLNEGGVIFKALSDAAIRFRDYLAQNSGAVALLISQFQQLAQAGVNLLADGMQRFTTALQANPNLMQELIAALQNAVSQTFQFAQGFGSGLQSVAALLAPIGSLVSSLMGVAGATGTTAENLGKATAQGLALVAGLAGLSTIAGIISGIGAAISGIVGIVTSLPAIVAGVSAAFATVAGTISVAFAALAPFLPLIAGITAAAIGAYAIFANWDAITRTIAALWERLNAWMSTIAQSIVNAFNQSAVFRSAWDAITTVVSNLIKPYKIVFDAIVNGVKSTDLFKVAWNGVRGVIDGIGNLFNQMLEKIGAIGSKLRGIIDQLKGAIGLGGGSVGRDSGGNQTGTSSGFTNKVIQVANRLGMKPEHLLTAMLYESAGTLSPSIQGPNVPGQGRATGLIQFMPSTARGLGTSPEALAKMSQDQQLDYVEKYFEPFKGQFSDFYSVYATIHGGNPRANPNASDGYRTTGQAAQEAQSQYAAKAQALLSGGIAARSQSLPTTPVGASGTTKFKDIVVTAARDGSGEPGMDYVTEANNGRSGRGAPVPSLTAGEVIKIRKDPRELGTGGERGYGNTAIVRTLDEKSGEFVDILYAHFDKLAVKVGDQVAIGSILGTQGRTGSTTGPHTSVDFFGKDSNQTTKAALAMRDRLARDLQNGATELNSKIGQTQQNRSQIPLTDAKGNVSYATQGSPSASSSSPKPGGTIAGSPALPGVTEKAIELARKLVPGSEKDRREQEKKELEINLARERTRIEALRNQAPDENARKIAEQSLTRQSIESKYSGKLKDYEYDLTDLQSARSKKVASGVKTGADYSAAIRDLQKLIELTKKQKDEELAAANVAIASEDRKEQKASTRAVRDAKRNDDQRKQLAELQTRINAQKDPVELAKLEGEKATIEIEFETENAIIKLRDDLEDNLATREYLVKINADPRTIAAADTKISEIGRQLQAASEIGQQKLEALAAKLILEREALELNRKNDLAAQSASMENRGIAILRARSQATKELNPAEANLLDREAALLEQSIKYKQALLELENQINEAKSKGIPLTEQQISTQRSQIEELNNLAKLDIANKFKDQASSLQQALADIGNTAKESLGSAIEGLLIGTKSLGDAFRDMVSSILSQVAKLAVNSLFSDLFKPKRSGLLGGGGGGILMDVIGGIFNAKDGGLVPNFAGGGTVSAIAGSGYRSGYGEISKALQREGSNAVLAALTPGELVLSLQQTRKFKQLGMDRVLNFANGGEVGGNTPSLRSLPGDNVTISQTINGGGSDVNWNQVAIVAQKATQQEILRQKRPRGSLSD